MVLHECPHCHYRFENARDGLADNEVWVWDGEGHWYVRRILDDEEPNAGGSAGPGEEVLPT